MSRPYVIALGTVLGGLALAVGSITALGAVGKEPWLSILFVASFPIAGVATAMLTRRMKRRAETQTIEQLDQQGLILREKCEARRAFQVEEFEDEGCQYFIELKNGSVLFLCGQYLYDYEPADGRFEARRPRTFPCTEFTLLRHKETGDILDVFCGDWYEIRTLKRKARRIAASLYTRFRKEVLPPFGWN